MDKTYLSIVLCGRNDNYGGDFRSRLQRCVSWTYDQLEKYQVKSEIIFVNYNPLASPDIKDFIDWPSFGKYVVIKLVTISNKQHIDFLKQHDVKKVPVLEYPAKNVGIRRAKGEFILCLNPDIIMGESLFRSFKELSPSNYYRVDRYDFSRLDFDNFESLLITKIWKKGIAFKIENLPIARINFLKLRFKQKFEFFRYSLLRKFNFLWETKLHSKAEYKYHCNVSGDFMLMHRKHWQALNGYNEQSYLSLHTDALMVVQAALSGLNEKVFNEPVYHQEHERRYDAAKENAEFREAYLQFQKEAQGMIKENKAEIYNDDTWGMYNFELEIVEM